MGASLLTSVQVAEMVNSGSFTFLREGQGLAGTCCECCFVAYCERRSVPSWRVKEERGGDSPI